ncbi:MAG: dihydrodipicolinate reductase C-terminal domain-containing protein [Myxococcota bacterium]
MAEGERLALSHAASSRDTVASGSVVAARWLASRPAGRYSLRQVLGIG